MGNKATTDNVAADMSPPNFRAAVKTLRTIKSKKDKVSSINGEISGIYDRVEGYKVNKKGARIFLMLDGLEEAERIDILRTVNGLADVAEWDKEASDLVDQAEDNVVHLRIGEGASAELPGGPEMDEVEAVVEAAADRSNAFLAAARGHLNAKADAQEPYMGDNSDLAGEDDDSEQ
jgi:hypothetical protein